MSHQYYPVSQPEEISIREREDAMGAYFMMFASFAIGLPLPVINLIAALIYYYTNKKSGRFVRFHILQSLLSQLPTTLLNAGLVSWVVRNIYFDLEWTDMFKGYLMLVALANLLYVIFSIVAAVKARKGAYYYFILFGPWAYHLVYKVRSNDNEPVINKPPRL